MVIVLYLVKSLLLVGVCSLGCCCCSLVPSPTLLISCLGCCLVLSTGDVDRPADQLPRLFFEADVLLRYSALRLSPLCSTPALCLYSPVSSK
ncbi:hypothetical protein M758_UG055800 [Ceratodon purpureus]|nr:hypothetical protein M758_UG055800 [Ceratodon purpureus]